MKCMRYEIKNMKMPPRIEEAMQMQVEAERKKRAAVLESEGVKQAEINVAEGKKMSAILASEASMQQAINEAQGESQAIKLKAQARASAIELVAKSLNEKLGGNAAALSVAEQYVDAFGNLAKSSNTLILPANASDPSSMVAQALTVYKNIINQQNGNANGETNDFVKFKVIVAIRVENTKKARIVKAVQCRQNTLAAALTVYHFPPPPGML
uniref:STML2-like C-terminal extension domain-containing protein n=1 Tax=Romanomermis culicivorax TaxID=13658 RepID=A0A915IFN3_ROMCU